MYSGLLADSEGDVDHFVEADHASADSSDAMRRQNGKRGQKPAPIYRQPLTGKIILLFMINIISEPSKCLFLRP